MPEQKVTYWAVSIFNSRTVWLNVAAFLVAMLSLTEVIEIIPQQFGKTVFALMAVLNLFLRTQSVRPVAFIAPGTLAPVEVKRLGPPAPPMVTD